MRVTGSPREAGGTGRSEQGRERVGLRWRAVDSGRGLEPVGGGGGRLKAHTAEWGNKGRDDCTQPLWLRQRGEAIPVEGGTRIKPPGWGGGGSPGQQLLPSTQPPGQMVLTEQPGAGSWDSQPQSAYQHLCGGASLPEGAIQGTEVDCWKGFPGLVPAWGRCSVASPAN